jgi:transcription termination/antitermination protein NusA
MRNLGGSELIQIIDAVSREKGIPRESLILALEDSLRIAAKRKYGQEQQIRAQIDRKSGEIVLYKEILVVANQAELELKYSEENVNCTTLEEAKIKDPNIAVGDVICEPIPAIEIGRIAAQSAKQVMSTRVREIERELEYDQFKERIGEIVHGVVDKVEYGNIYVKIGSSDAILKRDQALRVDRYKQGDRIRAYLVEIDAANRGPQIILSRTHDQFLAKLFAQEVPEIYDNIIQIKAVARDAGSRSKIAVYSSDVSIDAIGSCVGMRGARVQAVISELKGEKIDIINWSSDLGTMVVNAIAPAVTTKILIDEEQHKIEIVVPEDQFQAITKKFMEALDLEEILAQLLALYYNSIAAIANADVESLSSIEGLNIDIANELINRAKKYADSHVDADQVIEPSYLQGIENSPLLKIVGLRLDTAELMHKNNLNAISDIADLSRDEFKDIISQSDIKMDDKLIDIIIMDARKKSYFNKQNDDIRDA